MTGHRKWFSSLNPVSTKEYITFGDNGEGFEVRFKKGACHVLDAEETLVCSLLPFGLVFRVDLTSVSGPVRCLVASPSADVWKWHRRLGHLSFDLLVRKTSYELRFGRQPSVKHLRAFGCRCILLKTAGHLDKFESRCLDGIFLGYASSSRAFRVWILKAKQVVETCEVSFDESMPYTTPAFELSGHDEEGTPIFEDEEGADDVGDAGATAPAVAPAPSATSSDDEGGPLPTVSSSLPR
ncbi:hypothetical protein U9M48_027896 [Paspalum notatum var. saurae]|uniref:GAG-pre-integrase domain-containing protein n=1 Tax=Paspalum notatum var. saurae TaxID=547442 RepID=A0AAQ3TVM3_PASNO